MKYALTGFLILGSLILSGCEDEKVKLQPSPCVGLEGSPCGPKRPVNDWWQHQQPRPGEPA